LPKLMILYARYGDGHLQAAHALRDSFARHGIGEVKLVDLLAESHPMLNEVSRFVYYKSYTVWPKMYGWVYQATKTMKPGSLFSQWLHSFGAERLTRLIRQEQPDAVIHTFPMMVLPMIARRIGRRIPMYNVVTDFDLHMRWVHPAVNKYYVATEDLRQEMIRLGIPQQRIAVTGMPIRFSFAPGRCPAEDARRFGLDPNRPIVLVMAGAAGVLAGTRELCKRLTEDGGVQAALVCGRNRNLETSLRRQFAGSGNVSVFGYVDEIDKLMGIASCIVTKSGGLTCSEAIAAGLPIFLYRPVPGQERNNALYLQAKGAAAICRSPGEMAGAVRALLSDPARREAMRTAVDALRRDGAADRIALDIMHDLPIMVKEPIL